ncbi:gliding motility-associated lipoprotein GldH [Marivirga sericea]|uniref:Gliding motility-associated lipoprotein GldH n=1 Tax=Marivirga sericea TaxID=1028 RepID=A0A1X7K120_9BACT|nr:gliding motility lipoprotein GldH [Marivirga sericea]SMG33906.1 gliding motility-associated lipoprotein GldH [Marivirga sericea]
MRVVCSVIFLMFFISSCTEERYFEDNYDFQDRSWNMEESAEFNIEIDSIELPYQIKLNLRNTMDYPYRNLYIKYQVRDSTYVMEDKLLNIKLFEAKTGKPYGNKQSDIYAHQLSLVDSMFFPAKGKYTIELKQYMREMELEGMISAGIRIEQIKEQ